MITLVTCNEYGTLIAAFLLESDARLFIADQYNPDRYTIQNIDGWTAWNGIRKLVKG